MNKVKIEIEEVKKLKERMREINKLELSNIIWTENGKILNIDKNIIEDFEFCGLNNTDFIDMEFYKDGKSDKVATIVVMGKKSE